MVPAIHKHVKYWIKPNIENRIKNGEIKAYFNSEVTEIGSDYVQLQTPDRRTSQIPNDFVFAMIGYSPDLTFLNANGIMLEPETLKPRTDPKTLESERKGVFLAGVIVAGMHTNEIFIENGRFHGRQIADAIARATHLNERFLSTPFVTDPYRSFGARVAVHEIPRADFTESNGKCLARGVYDQRR